MSEREPIGVIGVGWVGLVTATCFAEAGHRVHAVDIDAAKIAALKRGETTIHEPGLDELLARNRERLSLTTDVAEALEGARLLFCCVDTPPTHSGDADLSRVRAVVERLRGGGEHALVMKSTVPVGTGASIRREVPDVAYVSCPEFLKEGSAIEDFMHPDRVVIGSEPGDGWAADALATLYEPFGGELVRTDVASAEMTKLASNAYLATKISFINEIANVCEEVGADVSEVARGMGLDKRIGPAFLRAGIGYGGSCLAGEATVLVRRQGRVWIWSLEELYELIAEDEEDADPASPGVLWPEELEVLSWTEGAERPEFLPVAAVTRRDYEGEVVEVRTKMGRRVRATADHPFIARTSSKGPSSVKPAGTVTTADWLPLALGWPALDAPPRRLDGRAGMAAAELDASDVIVRPGDEDLATIDSHGIEDREFTLTEHRQGASTSVLAKRIQPTGYRRDEGTAWVRVVEAKRSMARLPVYSLEVPGAHTFVTSGGLVVHNCFPKDVSALKQLAGNSGYHFQLLTAVIEVNELQKRRVIGKLTKHLGSLAGRRVALLGLAFKPDTDDMREASSLVLAARLQGEGATVTGYDPVAEGAARELLPGVEICASAAEALEGADAAVIVTEWPEFAELDWGALRARMATPLVVDGRNLLAPDAVRAAGLIYEGIGRPKEGAEGGQPVGATDRTD